MVRLKVVRAVIMHRANFRKQKNSPDFKLLGKNTIFLDFCLVKYVRLIEQITFFILIPISRTEISEDLMVEVWLIVQLLNKNIAIDSYVFLQVLRALPFDFLPRSSKMQVAVHKLHQVEDVVLSNCSRVDKEPFTNLWK